MQLGPVGGAMAVGGAMGMASAPASAGTSTVSNVSGQIDSGSASPPTTVAEALAGSLHTGVEQLAEFLKGFGSAEIIMALMLMAAMQKEDDDQQGGGSAAMGFLAGLALASQFGGSSGFELNAPVQEVGLEGGVGANLNVSA